MRLLWEIMSLTAICFVEEQIAFAEFPWLSANITRSNGKYLDEAYIIRDLMALE